MDESHLAAPRTPHVLIGRCASKRGNAETHCERTEGERAWWSAFCTTIVSVEKHMANTQLVQLDETEFETVTGGLIAYTTSTPAVPNEGGRPSTDRDHGDHDYSPP